jgi:uncharacterized protein YuzE
MRLTYDPAADLLYLYLTDRASGAPEVARTKEAAEGLMLDYDAEGRVIGVEILAVSSRPGANPMQMAFEVLTADREAEAA